MDWKTLESEALELFRRLLRTDTQNPPGNETAACRVLAEYLDAHGISVRIYEAEPGRGNLVADLEGETGPEDRLVLSGHLDVVPVEGQQWSVDPFGAEIRDGFLYGRGAVDMKHMVAMSAVVLRALKASGRRVVRGLVLAAVADEEVGGQVGAAHLVDRYPDEVRGRFYLGEVGGFTLRMGSGTAMPIQVAERGRAVLRLRTTGPSGHGSLPQDGSALLRLAEAVAKVGRTVLPVHLVPSVEAFLAEAAELLGPVQGRVLGGLSSPLVGRHFLRALGRLAPDRKGLFQAMLTNTAVPTVFQAGTASNVVPAEAEAVLDGRYLPGQTAQDLQREVQEVVGPDVTVEILSDAPPVEVRPFRTHLYDLMVEKVRRAWPGVRPLPSLTPGYTDAKHFSRLGLVCYGFTPVRMPPDITFSELFHAPDERIPVQGFFDGLRLLYDVVEAYCCPVP